MNITAALLKKRYTRTVLCVLLLFIIFKLFYLQNTYNWDIVSFQEQSLHESMVERFYDRRKELTTSNLGKLLFKDEDVTSLFTEQNRTYVVLVWKYWDWLKKRHVYNYGSSESDPLEDCSVKNCIFTGEDNKIDTVDAVVVHLQHGDVPQVKIRNPAQRWIFLNDEAPNNAFSLSKRRNFKDYVNIFNWSMTYRTDADIPVPYGRTIPLENPVYNNFYKTDLANIVPNWKKKKRDVLATILISNCGVSYRMQFISELQKYMSVDVYGGCSTNEITKKRCPGHFRADCDPISEYLFYLVLENSGCREYLTEKIWYHAYSKGAVPIIVGPSLGDCEKLLPPDSYIYFPLSHIKTHVETLAKEIIEISEDRNLLHQLHNWRNHFRIVNEHGYFGTKSRHFCRVCEALNYNDVAPKIYNESEISKFLDPKLLCKQ